MPMVTRASRFSINSNALTTLSRKRSTFRMRWSLGATIILASGLMALMWWAAQAIHGAVLRRTGSSRICRWSISGSCSLIIGSYISLVMRMILSTGTMPCIRSNAVCSKLRPVPKKSRNCLGFSALLKGQKRLPTPPHMITQYRLLFIGSLAIFV